MKEDKIARGLRKKMTGHYGNPRTYPYFIRFKDNRVSGVFKTKSQAKKALKRFGKGTIIDRRK